MKYIIANWKMNFDKKEVVTWQKYFKKSTKNKIILSPSFPHIGLIKKIDVAAQNIFHKTEGAYTGQVSILQIKDVCKYCIIGHSELSDSTELKKLKIKLCLENNVIPIVCFSDQDEISVLNQDGIIFTWEDPTKISHGGDYIDLNMSEIKQNYLKLKTLAGDSPVLYGGSVNRQNIKELVNIGVDGVLVGKASIDPSHFEDIVRAFN